MTPALWLMALCECPHLDQGCLVMTTQSPDRWRKRVLEEMQAAEMCPLQLDTCWQSKSALSCLAHCVIGGPLKLHLTLLHLAMLLLFKAMVDRIPDDANGGSGTLKAICPLSPLPLPLPGQKAYQQQHDQIAAACFCTFHCQVEACGSLMANSLF